MSAQCIEFRRMHGLVPKTHQIRSASVDCLGLTFRRTHVQSAARRAAPTALQRKYMSDRKHWREGKAEGQEKRRVSCSWGVRCGGTLLVTETKLIRP